MSLSLEASIRTCKVDTGWANRIQSDRFENPNLMVCPVWNGMDLAGREVCPDSFYTKRAGCNSAEDRVLVENAVGRPQYMEYIALNANGIKGDIYEGQEPFVNTMPWQASANASRDLQETYLQTGQFGQNTQRGNIYPTCLGTSDPTAKVLGQEQMAAQAQANRMAHGAQESFVSNQKRSCSGF
jgi:hypothetical protein